MRGNDRQRRHALFWRLFLCLAGCGLAGLGGCAPTTLVPASHNSFAGIGALAAAATPQQPLHILLIHGMGTTQASAFNAFMAGTARRLGLVQVGMPAGAAVADGIAMPNPVPIPTPGVPDSARALLYNFAFAPAPQSAPTLVFTYLLWAPLTAAIKQERLAETGAPPRQLFANAAKEFIADKLGDVVLYGGTFRDKVMRPAVEAALCAFLGGTPGRDDIACQDGGPGGPTVVVTHSLGGYMLIDALDDELNKQQPAPSASAAAFPRLSPRPAAAATRFLRNTRFVYMLANQLALLDLTTLDGYPSNLPNPNPDSCTTSRKHRLLDRLGCDWNRARGAVGSGAAAAANDRLQIVAFSDPNDILSYLVRHEDVGLSSGDGASQRRYFTNVYLTNDEFDIPGLFSDPVQAHVGYLDNPRVLDLFVCGMAKGAVAQPCPPPAPPPR